MSFAPPAKNPTAADNFVRGKSAHQLLALIAAGQTGDLTPAQVAQADVDRQARKAEAAAAA